MLCALLIFSANGVWAGQNVDISNTQDNVCLGAGSSCLSGGSDSSNNTLNVNSGGTINNVRVGKSADGATDASNNTLNINSGGKVKYETIGGYVENSPGTFTVTGSATNNAVNVLAGGSAASVQDGEGNYKDVIGGRVASTGDNSANITVSGSAKGNSVSIADGDAHYILGGLVYTKGGNSVNITGNAGGPNDGEGNTVNFTGGTNKTALIGGALIASSASEYSSTVNITIDGNAQNNNVNISGGTFSRDWDDEMHYIAGGMIGVENETSGTTEITGSALNNTVNISGGNITNRDIYGGMISAYGNNGTINGNANDNTISISGGNINNSIIAGGVIDGNNNNGSNVVVGTNSSASNNTINITGGTINADVIEGGHFWNVLGGKADGNEINFTGGNITVKEFIIGGRADVSASGNIITIGKDVILNTNNAALWGGDWIAATSAGNILNLAGAGRTFYGVQGFQNYNFDLSGVLADSTMLTALHGSGDSKLGGSNSALDIAGATIGLENAAGEDVRPDALGLGEKITLIDATGGNLGFSGTLANSDKEIVDGNNTYNYSWLISDKKLDLFYDSFKSNDGEGNTSEALVYPDTNTTTVNITGNPTVDSVSAVEGITTIEIHGSGSDGESVVFDNVHISGGTMDIQADDGVGVAFNTLNAKGANTTLDLHGGTLDADEKALKFWILQTLPTANEAMLNVNGKANITDATDVKVVISGESAPLRNGQNIVLLKAEEITGNKTQGMDNAAEFRQGVTVNYQVNLKFNNQPVGAGAAILTGAEVTGNETPTELIAVVAGTSATGESKALSEGRAASVAFVNQGGELAADNGLLAAVSAAGGAKGFAAFTAGTLGKSRYETGSYADVKGTSFMAGLAKEFANKTFGMFFEYGNGNYNTNNSFAGGAVKGDGDNSYVGGGLLGKIALENNYYADASLRLGSVKSNFSGNLGGTDTSYNYDSLYYGAHLGGGKVFELGAQTKLDAYGKYLFTRQNGKDVNLSTGDGVNFAAAYSNRVRVGVKATHNLSEVVAPYIGLAYDYELSAKFKATNMTGDAIDAPSLKGSTGIGEIGVSVGSDALSVDLGAQGYAGKRKGVSGSLKLGYKF
jgi:hypothetical protein